MIDRARLIRLINNLDYCGVTTWTTRRLRKCTYITGQDLWRLETRGVIVRAPRDPKGRRVWSREEMRCFLARLREIMEQRGIITLPLENDKYLRHYGLIAGKRWGGV